MTDPVDKLLQEGLSSYIEALIAVREFRRELQNRARAVVERRFPELLRALRGGHAGEAAIAVSNYANGTDDAWPGDHAWAAVKVRTPEFGSWYCGILWRRAEDRDPEPLPGVVVAADLNGWGVSRRQALSGLEASGVVSRCVDTGYEAALWRRIDPSATTEYPKHLDEMITEWAVCLTKAGGIGGLRR